MVIPENLDDVFGAVDLNRNGYITYGNFLAATLPQSLRCRVDLCQRVFRLLDQNRDGFIDEDDLAVTFLCKDKMGHKGFRKLCSQAILEVSGSDEKTKIDFDDFLRIMVGANSPITAAGFECCAIETQAKETAKKAPK